MTSISAAMIVVVKDQFSDWTKFSTTHPIELLLSSLHMLQLITIEQRAYNLHQDDDLEHIIDKLRILVLFTSISSHMTSFAITLRDVLQLLTLFVQ